MDVAEGRKILGISRKDLAHALGWPQSRVWSIEKGRRDPTPEEEDELLKVLGDVAPIEPDDQSTDGIEPTTGEQKELDGDAILRRRRIEKETPEGAIRLLDWNGIANGDLVKVKGEQGTFRFWFHHKDETQEYVEVIGGKGGHMQRRSFSPDRITARRRVRSRAIPMPPVEEEEVETQSS